MKNIVSGFTCLLIWFYTVSAQECLIKGTIKDAVTNETIIGASVMYAEGKGAVTDINGNFSIKIDSSGTYNLTISYVGYEPQKLKVKVTDKPVVLNFSLSTTTLNEVESKISVVILFGTTSLTAKSSAVPVNLNRSRRRSTNIQSLSKPGPSSP